jgi:branched-chain amino acid aminotransferase
LERPEEGTVEFEGQRLYTGSSQAQAHIRNTEANAKVSVFDHGLLYGDGIFEGIRFYNGRVFRLEQHLERLWDSARSICLEIPMTPAGNDEALLETIRQNHLRDGYIRLIVTRGVGNLGLNPEQCKNPSVIIIAATIALYPRKFYRKGLTVVTARRGAQSGALNPAVKSLELFEQRHGADRSEPGQR